MSAAPADPAATVVVARACADDTFEVFLVKRHGKSGFMAGAHVFPGGRVDDDDASFDHDRFAVAAIRETWEETGVLLARSESGLPLTTRAPIDAVAARVVSGLSFAQALTAVGLLPDVELLTPIAWWITPEAEPRRYDTRFFFATVPSLQRHTATADGTEVVEGEWLTPHAALEAYRSGRITLSPPTLVTLEELAPLKLGQVRQHRWPTRAVRPVVNEVEGALVLALPGDPLHDVAEPVWPERTRIVQGDDRRFRSAKA
jgi:8-oxo-dGTP pyrophosphatase MutT (NUDIX family)